jgi:hypothetical protein
MIKKYPILKKISSNIFYLFSKTPFKTSVKTIQFLSLLVFLVFSFKGNAQCTITGETVNSSTINPCTTLSGCSIIYVGDGINPTTLTIDNNIDLSCLGSVQLVVRNSATIFFQASNRLILEEGSNLIIETGGNLAEGTPCSASQRIYIGSDLISSCNGGGGGSGVFDFGEIVTNGGYSSINATANPSSICNEGISVITATAIPSSGATYRWYDVASGGSPIQNGGNTFNTGVITTSKSYYVEAYYSAGSNSYSTVRKSVTVTVNSLPSAPTVGAITQPTCSLATGSVVLNGLPAGNWIINPGGIVGSTASTTISGLAAGTYNYTVTSAAGCTSTASANVVISAQPVINSWNGNGTIANWNNPANWCIGVPNINFPNTLNVVIPSGFYVTINPSDMAEVVNIAIESDAILNIVDNYLKVTGNLTLNGKIDLNGESQLVQGAGSNLYGTGTIEIDQQGEGNKYRYNYWSMPVYADTDLIMGKHTTISASLRDGTIPGSPLPINFSNSGYDGALTTPITLSTYWMYKYANSGSGYSAWNQVRSTGKVYTGQGFTMKGPGAPGSPAQNYVFVGTPNNGTIELTVAKDYDYLVGNPYPSALDADQFLMDNSPSGTASITGAIYFWEHYGGDTHNLAGYQGGYATYSLGGEAPAAAFPGLGGGSSVKGAPKQFIPAGQAFFVVGDATDGGQIQFNNGQRVFKKESLGEAVFMKSSNNKAKTDVSDLSDLRPKFRIGFDAPKISHRQILLTIDERATPLVDWGFDAEIYEIFADDMYWILNDKKYVIQATNETGLNSEVPLGIQLSKTGMVTVKIDALENVDDDTSLYLKDKVTGESFNIREKPVQLNLTAGKYTDRFVLIFKTQKLVAEEVKAEVLIPAIAQPVTEGIHVFMNKAIGELQIKNNSSDEIVGVALRNALGQTVKMWNSNFKAKTISLPISITTGIYLVQINTKTGKTVKKISVE